MSSMIAMWNRGRRAAFLLSILPLVAATASAEILPGALEGAVARYARTAGLSSVQEATLREDAGAAVRGGASADLLADLLGRFTEVGAGPDDVLEGARRARALAEEDLPADPVVDRYLQGLSKGVPLDRIRQVADGIEARLREFADLASRHLAGFRERGTPEERRSLIEQGAYALGAGAPPGHLGRALDLVPPSETSLGGSEPPLLALACLVGVGVDPDRSLEVVEAAWERGIRGDDLSRFGRDLGVAARFDPDPGLPVVDEALRLLRGGDGMARIADFLEEIRKGEGNRPPGAGPMEDPASMRGPGGPPESPGNQGTHGRGGPRSGENPGQEP